MKYKHTITIADVQINIVTEEDPKVVEAMVGILDRRIREIFVRSDNRCPKIEAALLCALDYCIEKNTLQETINRMEEELGGVDVKALVAELAELKSEKEQLCGQLTYAEQQARNMKNDVDIANDQIRILQTQVESATEVTAANADLAAKVAELEAALAAKDEAIAAKDGELEAKNGEIEKLTKTCTKAEERISELEKEIEDLEETIDELECEIVNLEEEIEDLEEAEEVEAEVEDDEEENDEEKLHLRCETLILKLR